MADIPIMIVSNEEWKRLTDKYGEAAADHKGDYNTLSTEDYPGYFVARGTYIESGSTTVQPTKTGYLQKGNDVDGWVSQLPD